MSILKKKSEATQCKNKWTVSKLRECDSKKLCSLPHSLYMHMCFVLFSK